MIKETKMIIGSERIVVVGQHVGESVRNISTSDNFLGFTGLVGEQEERKNDTAYKEPLSDVEVDRNAAFKIVLGTIAKDLVGPSACCQHGDGGEDIGDVDEERL